MKKQVSILFILILVPLFGHAQQPSLNPDKMQRLMQQAAQMQACMSRIDQQAMMALGQEAQDVEAEIKSLCQANKRSQALNTAIEFGQSMDQDENIKIAKECGEMAQGMLPSMNFPTSEEDLKERHICDAY